MNDRPQGFLAPQYGQHESCSISCMERGHVHGYDEALGVEFFRSEGSYGFGTCNKHASRHVERSGEYMIGEDATLDSMDLVPYIGEIQGAGVARETSRVQRAGDQSGDAHIRNWGNHIEELTPHVRNLDF